jgi:AraC-like DNA-binding protein
MGVELSARLIYRLCLVGRRAGVSRRELEAHLPTVLDEPPELDRRVGLSPACDAIEWMRALPGLGDLPLRIAFEAAPDNLDPSGALIAVSRTLRDGLSRAFNTAWPLWGSIRTHSFETTPRGAAIRYAWPPEIAPRPARATFDEWTVCETLLGARTVLSGSVRPLRVAFGHPRALGADAIESFVRTEIEWGAAATELELSANDLDTPLRGYNAVVRQYLLHRIEVLCASLAHPERISEGVQRLVRRSLGREEIDLPIVAKKLGMSARALQRRLSEEGASFASILDDARRELACEALSGGAPISEVAPRLGFADRRSFHRAFRRWTGKTPEQWRGSRA